MTGKPEDTVTTSHEDALTAAKAWATAENLTALDALSDDDIAEQIANNPDAASELTDMWFDNARLVITLKARRAA